jgi:hypothetical protein
MVSLCEPLHGGKCHGAGVIEICWEPLGTGRYNPVNVYDDVGAQPILLSGKQVARGARLSANELGSLPGGCLFRVPNDARREW